LRPTAKGENGILCIEEGFPISEQLILRSISGSLIMTDDGEYHYPMALFQHPAR
jgi:hypothetical protein